MSSLPPVRARFSYHSLLNDCTTVLGPITLATKIEVFLGIRTNNGKVKKKKKKKNHGNNKMRSSNGNFEQL